MAVRVCDTGIGIGKEDFDRLFSPFGRVPVPGRLTEGTTGLGLYLSKKLAWFLGGDIMVEREVQRGSVFSFTLPKTYEEQDGTQFPGEVSSSPFIDRPGQTLLSMIIRDISECRNQEMGQQPPRWQRIRDLLDTIHMTGVAGSLHITNETENMEIYAYPVIEKVFWHMVDNSVKHGKKVTEIRITAHESAFGCTRIYQDNGVGIPVDMRKDHFTKSFGKETGYSLFFVHDLLEISGMTTAETGEPGNGVRFEIGVPRGLYRFVSC